ncbi:MAG: ATP synthase subunit I [Nitrospiraceae bacterium]|nr:ATP synthase subunit I [Nitrospiraceae bacterium]
MMGRIYRRALIALAVFAGLSALYPLLGGDKGVGWKMWVDWKMAGGVFVGGMLALANLRGLVWGVTGLLGTQKATTKLVFFSAFRFMLIVIILLALLKMGLINPIGVFIGLTVVFTVLVIEGLREAGRQKNSETGGGDGDTISSE